MKRHATAHWQGSGKEGSGRIETQSNALSNSPYSYNTRFEEGQGTNPEELVAAAHAGCFTMKLSFVLGEKGFTPTDLETKCEIDFKAGSIVGSHLIVTAKIDGISKEQFDEAVNDAAMNCPISKLLNTAITHHATLL